MKKSSKVLAIALALVLVFLVIGLVACNDNHDNNSEPSDYEVNWANNFGTVSFFNGNGDLIAQGKLSEHLDLVAQETVEIDGTKYVYYSFLPIIQGITIPTFSKIKFISSDNNEKTIDFAYARLSEIIAIVGIVENEQFSQFNTLSIAIGTTTYASSDIFANLTKVVFDPEETLDLDTITMNDVTVYSGENTLFTFTKNDLKALDQHVLTLTAEEKQFVAFKFTDIVSAKNATLPTITKVKVGSMEQNITSLNNSYILVSKVENGAYDTLNNIPRFVFDSTTVQTMNTDVAKAVAEIYINPVDTPDPQLTALATLTFAWSNGKDVVVTVDAVDNEYDCTIAYTVDGENAVTSTITTSKGTISAPAVTLTTKNNNDGTKTYYGYTMTDLFSCIGKINNSNQFKAANYEVALVRMTVGSGFSETEIDDVSTGYIINWYKSGASETRVFKDSTDIRNVQSITLYKTNA